tara:strand:+ start:25 stop:582 length:558 start_codon:yes stop_codon:yes gene_type:complete
MDTNLLITYNKLLTEYLNNTILFYTIKKDLSMFLYNMDQRSNIDYLRGNIINNIKRINSNYEGATNKLKNDNNNLKKFKKQYILQDNSKMILTKISGSHINRNIQYNEYIDISKKYMTKEKRLFLLLKKITEFQSEIKNYNDYIKSKLKPIIFAIKKIQRNWKACRYNPKYKMCYKVFKRHFELI